MNFAICVSFALSVSFLAAAGSIAQSNPQPLSHKNAEESDPRRLGWMEGFPPPSEKLIMQPETDYFSFPKLRWTVCHIRELMPTKQVGRGID